MEEYKYVVVNVSDSTAWSPASDMPEAEKELKKAAQKSEEDSALYREYILKYPDNKKYWEARLEHSQKSSFRICSRDEYFKMQREKWLSKKAIPVTKEKFYEMLDILPPMNWCTIDGIEMFCMSEFTSGVYTSQYAKDGLGNYYCATVDAYDKSTWINNLLKQNNP